jgi:hypothetical protein
MKRSELEKYLGKNVTVYFHKYANDESYHGVLRKTKATPLEYDYPNYYYCQRETLLDKEVRFRCSYVLKVVEKK